MIVASELGSATVMGRRVVRWAVVVIVVLMVGAWGSAASAAARRPRPTPAQVQAYLCAVTPHSNDANPTCQAIPGFWNDWYGRTTPPRWDPCNGRSTLVHQAPCGPMSPTIPQWCTLHFDHHVAGWNICAFDRG